MVRVIKNSFASAGDEKDMGSIPGSGRSPGGGHGNLFHYYCLERTMERLNPKGPKESGHD